MNEIINNLVIHEGFLYISTTTNRIFRKPLENSSYKFANYDWKEIDPPGQLLSTAEPESEDNE